MVRNWLLVAGVAACGGGSKPAPAPQVVANKQPEAAPAAAPAPTSPMDRLMAAMERFTNEMCACGPGNEACANDVTMRLGKWAQAEEEKKKRPEEWGTSDAPPTEAQQKALVDYGTRMGKCMQASMAAPTP